MFKKISEDELNPEFMIKTVIKSLTYSGCRPGYRTWWEKISGLFFITYCAMMAVLHILYFAFVSNINLGNLIQGSMLLFGYLQLSAKFYVAITKGDLIKTMLTSVWNDFWLINRMDEKHKKSAIFLYKLAKRISDTYKISCLAGISLLIVQTLLKMDKSLIDEIWIPHKEILRITPYYEIIFAVQSIMLFLVGLFCMIPLDQLFIQLIFFVCVQFQILREEIKLLNIGDDSDKIDVLKRIVNHHNTLIRFLELFENVFSKLVLFTVGLDYMNITLTMFGIAYEKSINRQVMYFTIYLTMMTQILAYCIAGQLVQDQSLSVGEAAYKIEWYSISDLQIRKDIMTIICRSQREIQLTAGGIMYLNMESFLKIVKTTVSLLTFLFNVRKEDV